MKKTKNKKSKAGKKTLLGGAGKSLKKLGKGRRKLSLTQKVVGGALLALGVGFLAKRFGYPDSTPGLTSDMAAAEESLAAMDEGPVQAS